MHVRALLSSSIMSSSTRKEPAEFVIELASPTRTQRNKHVCLTSYQTTRNIDAVIHDAQSVTDRSKSVGPQPQHGEPTSKLQVCRWPCHHTQRPRHGGRALTLHLRPPQQSDGTEPQAGAAEALQRRPSLRCCVLHHQCRATPPAST